MTELKDTAARPERVFLVGVRTDDIDRDEAESLLRELGGLAKSLGLEPCGSLMAKVRERHAGYFLGSGKVEEIIAAAKADDADSIVFDHPLSPGQQRNWEKDSGLSVYDRHELIIRIFASRARTREASLQVELAQLKYALPRLAHSHGDLMRQRGGRYGNKGSGEQQLELDRREIEKRIADIRDELESLRKSRAVQKKKRERISLPRAAVVGYTNVGKSSLLNAITKATVLAEDKLFATLDPTTRRIAFKSGGTLLVTDTVGFVRNLPHGLVEAFKSTLEEAADADILIHVVDASDPEFESRFATTTKVLAEIGAAGKPTLVAFNKVDLVADRAPLLEAAGRFPGSVIVSVRTGEGLPELLRLAEVLLTADSPETTVRIPDSDYAFVALARREASVIRESREDDASVLVVRIPERLRSRFAPFVVSG
ncbi:MAG: GTPase HflX [Spirochaetes bacterium]|nr:GTPase HflX [Spirochaetota bacterium]